MEVRDAPRLAVLTVTDGHTREAAAVAANHGIAAVRETRILDQPVRQRGLPRTIRNDARSATIRDRNSPS